MSPPPLVWAGQTASEFYGRTLEDEDYDGPALDERESARLHLESIKRQLMREQPDLAD